MNCSPQVFYRLSDIDGDWVNGGSNRLANYTDLKPGEYLFEVKAENGGNSSPVTSFRIIIKPPYWQTTWYKACLDNCNCRSDLCLYQMAHQEHPQGRKKQKEIHPRTGQYGNESPSEPDEPAFYFQLHQQY
ncbi:MAG: hypothetical protein IPP93_18665 [Chitinophagaceae bacterium]|nr:hypothetical protein [Chitinophagaceae bacterium]